MKKTLYTIGIILLILFVIGLLSSQEKQSDEDIDALKQEVLDLMEEGGETPSEIDSDGKSLESGSEDTDIGVSRSELEQLKRDIERLEFDDLSSFSQ